MNLRDHNQDFALSEELEKAEEAHFKNCPNAEFSLRLASTTVDLILTYLAIAGIQNSARAFTVFLSYVPSYTSKVSLLFVLSKWITSHASQISFLTELFLKAAFVYSYFIVSTAFSGGTPGKLLFGLRVLNFDSGKKLSSWTTTVRFLVAAVSGFLSCGVTYFIIFFNKETRAYHDIITQSCVKKVHGVR